MIHKDPFEVIGSFFEKFAPTKIEDYRKRRAWMIVYFTLFVFAVMVMLTADAIIAGLTIMWNIIIMAFREIRHDIFPSIKILWNKDWIYEQESDEHSEEFTSNE